ncbi:MAG: endolytic transglycosylase MltG [Clostridiales bacterium]|jgi:UPF0755 protein|nr:endolytic transglycosylase MltG [Clostridiales bacterium]
MKKHPREDYTYDSLIQEREYGLYWYSWLWNILRPVLIFVCSVLLLIGLVSFGWGKISAVFIDPVDRNDKNPVIFSVASGDSLTRVSNNLQNQNLIRNRSVFKYFADFMGFGQKIQAGEYTLSRSMTINEIADQLTSGDGKPIVRNITIIPGWTVENIADYLLKEGAIDNRDAFLAKARSGSEFAAYYYIADVLASPGASQRKYALEGYLSPDTYEVFTDATVDDLIKKLLSQTEAVFKEPLHARAEEIGMTMDQVITLASLIEKEAKTADFARVSSVFHNRLRQNMSLGSDVTIKYISGTTRMALNREDLNLQSPYNTYLVRGLPPGPICSPSPGAIMAALYPDEQFLAESYLYFCSKDPDTGELHFSKTLAEHEYAVSIYAPLWEAYDRRTNAQ